MNIKNTLLAAALAGSGALGAVSAQAMPLARLNIVPCEPARPDRALNHFE